MRISDWSSDVCSSDLGRRGNEAPPPLGRAVSGERGPMSRARMTMRAVIERNTESGTDEYSHPLPPVFATLHAALPCWVWSTSRRTVVDGDKTEIGGATCRERVCKSV